MGSCAVHIDQKIYTSQNTEWRDNTPRLYLILAFGCAWEGVQKCLPIEKVLLLASTASKLGVFVNSTLFLHFCPLETHANKTLLALAALLSLFRSLIENENSENGTSWRDTKEYHCTPGLPYTTVGETFVSAYILSRRISNASAWLLQAKQQFPITCGIRFALWKTKTRGKSRARIVAFPLSTILEPHSTSRTTRLCDTFAPVRAC